jgi:hypothetical protein
MRRIQFAIVTVILGSLIAGVAAAGTPGLHRRQARQHVRIAQGVRCGELTRAEALRLRAGQRQIRRLERRARGDGFVSRRERARIHQLQNRENRAIYRLRHNRLIRA